MELWNFVVTTLANVPSYFERNPVLFVLVSVLTALYIVISLGRYLPAVVAERDPLFKVIRLIVSLLGIVSVVAAGIAFTSANEIAELRVDMLTPAFFIEIAVVGVLFTICQLIVAGAADPNEYREDEPLFTLAKNLFFVIYSIVGAFIGTGISSWGFSIFGQTIGTWLFGAFLAWAISAIFYVAASIIELPLMLLAGDPASHVEEAYNNAVDNIGNELDKTDGKRRVLAVIVPAAVIVALIAGLGFAIQTFMEDADKPNVHVDHVIVWNDEVLEAYVRYLTGMSEGDIWYHDVCEITELDLSVRPNSDGVIEDGPRITDITALSNFTGLQVLNLRYQNVEDLSAVENMEELVSLDIFATTASDLTPLESCTKLETLIAGYCDIDDISPLAGLTSLTGLYLAHNSITDIGALGGLTNLTYLNLEDNPIEDYSVFYVLSVDEVYI